MKKRAVVKSVQLLVLYTVVFIGIFVWQFWGGTGVLRDFGAMQLSVATGAAEDGGAPLLEGFVASFCGLQLSVDASSPCYAVDASGERRALSLADWEQLDGERVRFSFDDGSALLLSVSDDTDSATLTMTVEPSEGIDGLFVPYRVAKPYVLADVAEGRRMISARDRRFAFVAAGVSDDGLLLTRRDGATYGVYEPRVFAFASVSGRSGTDDKSYIASLNALRDGLVTKGTQALRDSATAATLTESDLVAYLAEMSFRGRLAAALNAIPASFRNGSGRTYLSTPYFGDLVAMNRSLASHTAEIAAAVRAAISAQDLGIYTFDGIADYVLRERKTDAMKSLLRIPAEARPFTPTLLQAAGILSLYTHVRKLDGELAGLLEPRLEQCVAVITHHLSLDEDGVLALTAAEVRDEFAAANEGDEALPELTVEERLRVGQALLEFGRGRNRVEYADTGRLLIHQELSAVAHFSVHELASLYPFLVQDNSYYPHTELLGYYGERPVWAWTIATSLSYKPEASGVVNISIGFPLERSQYIIINGVPTFYGQIEIQGIMFRTDPRFEAYNSSGYRYEEESDTLLLKSRHKSQTELVRLFCDPVSSFTYPDDSLASMQQQVQDLGLSNVTVRKSDEGLTLSVENIQFEAESSVLRSSEFPKLQQIAQILKVAYLDNDIMISGHTAKSSIGRPPQELSEERANTVADYLAELGVRERSHIFTQGFGDTKPVAPNDTEEERAKNRRVEITIMNK